ncbi:hypothetical protein BJX70DRAFT_406663 [Aspergillus crustosus]
MPDLAGPSSSSSAASSPGSGPSSPDSISSAQSHTLPDRTARAAPKPRSPQTFLFVDGQADGSRGSSLRKKKQAFIVKKYHQERKQASLERLKAARPPTETRSPAPRASIGPISRASTAEYGDEVEIKEEEIVPGVVHKAAVKVEAWSLMPYLSQGFMDPFNCYAIHMTDSMHMYLDYSAYPLNVTTMGIFLWKNAITIPALLNILLYFSAKHLSVLGSKNGVSSQLTSDSMKDSMRLQGTALRFLNKLLQDPKTAVTQPTIITIACFVTIEASMANLEAVEAHLNGLKRLVDLMGGLESLHHMTLSRLYQCDVKGASVRKSRPVFPMSPRFRHNILNESTVFQPRHTTDTTPTFLPAHLTPLGTRFTTAPWFPTLDPQIRASIEILHRLILYFESVNNTPTLGTPTDNDLLVVTEHQLHSLSFTPDDHDLNEPLRLSFLIYLNIRVWHLQNLPIMACLVGPLRHILTRHLLSFQSLAPDLVFWMLFMGGMASRGDEVHCWFVERISEIAPRLGVWDWRGAREMLSGFFYSDQRGQMEAEDLWDEVLLARAVPRRIL